MSEHVVSFDLSALLDVPVEMAPDVVGEWLDSLESATVTVDGFWNGGEGIVDTSSTVSGRAFRRGRLQWVIRTKRWTPLDRKHHARPKPFKVKSKRRGSV